MSVSGDSVSTLADYNALSTQIAASGYPTGTASGSYSPTNSPQACPPIQLTGDEVWAAGDILPPTPNITACDCMYTSLSCFPASSVLSNSTGIGTLFNTVCGLDASACAGIKANATTGVYGPYVMCNSTQQLAFVLNEYYLHQGSSSGACDFGGQAVLVGGTPSVASTCSAVLQSASSAVSQAATATAGSASGTSSSKNEAGLPPQWGVGMFDIFVGGYLLVSAGVGAAMVLL